MLGRELSWPGADDLTCRTLGAMDAATSVAYCCGSSRAVISVGWSEALPCRSGPLSIGGDSGLATKKKVCAYVNGQMRVL